MNQKKNKWIRASEIGEYLYCRRSWWLQRVQGLASQNVRELAEGTEYHQAHGRSVQKAMWAQRIAYVVFGLVLFILIYHFLIL